MLQTKELKVYKQKSIVDEEKITIFYTYERVFRKTFRNIALACWLFCRLLRLSINYI